MTAKGCPYEATTLRLEGGTGLRSIDEAIVRRVYEHEEVAETTPMLMVAIFDPNKGETGGLSAYLGVDPATYPRMKTYLKFQRGRWFTKPHAFEAVMGYEAAELEQREVGDLFLIPEKNIELKVVGVLARTGTQDNGTIFVPLDTLQKVFEKEGKLTSVGVKVKNEANISLVEQKPYDLPMSGSFLWLRSKRQS